MFAWCPVEAESLASGSETMAALAGAQMLCACLRPLPAAVQLRQAAARACLREWPRRFRLRVLAGLRAARKPARAQLLHPVLGAPRPALPGRLAGSSGRSGALRGEGRRAGRAQWRPWRASTGVMAAIGERR